MLNCCYLFSIFLFKKRAFYTPIREWFFTVERRQSLNQYLSPAALKKTGFFKPELVEQYMEEVNIYGQPDDLDQYYFVLRREWVLFLVLSIQMLHTLFVEREAPCFKLDD